MICSLTLGLVLLTCINAKNASFDIDKYMSDTVISDFEVKDSSIASNFSTYDPRGTTISDQLVSQIRGLDGLEDTGRLYSQVLTHRLGESALENIRAYYNADDRLPYIEQVDPGLAEAYHEAMDSGECTAILYGTDGLVLDTFASQGYMIDGTFDKERFLSGDYVLVEASSGAEYGDSETQPTYAVGDRVELGGKEYEVMGIVKNIRSITEGVSSSTASFVSFYLPADTFHEMYPDNTLRKLFFNVDAEDQAAAEKMLTDYQQNVDKTLTYTSKNTLIEHYEEQTRAMLIDEGLYYAGATLIASYVIGAIAVGVGVRMMVAGDWTSTFHFTLTPLLICTPVLIAFAVLIPYICFKNLEKQSVVERLRAVD